MQQMERSETLAGTDRKRVEAVVEALAGVGKHSENVAELAHDARNMLAALGLYCDLLEEPGVLAAPYRHYGDELRLVAAACRRLVEKLASLDGLDQDRREQGGRKQSAAPDAMETKFEAHIPARSTTIIRPVAEYVPGEPIWDLRRELLANANLLDAMAGPAITVTVRAVGGARPVRLTGEDLTRVLVNLVKNAAEAIHGKGNIWILLRECMEEGQSFSTLVLTVEDSGPGFPEDVRTRIFEPGFTTRMDAATNQFKNNEWPVLHRGLGLSISRGIIEAADGRLSAGNREQGGAIFQIELPTRTR